MDFNDYQDKAHSTAIYPDEFRGIYPVLGLCGESGEVAEKVKKMLRDNTPLDDVRDALKGELGDILWYVANTAWDYGICLDDIAVGNIKKLADRKERNVLHGSGDKR